MDENKNGTVLSSNAYNTAWVHEGGILHSRITEAGEVYASFSLKGFTVPLPNGGEDYDEIVEANKGVLSCYC